MTASYGADMALTTTCPSCGLNGRFPDEWQGRSVQCPRCHAVVPLGIPVTPSPQPPNAAPAAAPKLPFPPPSPPVPAPPASDTSDRVSPLVPLVAPSTVLQVPPEEDPTVRQWVGEETRRFHAYVAKQLAALR